MANCPICGEAQYAVLGTTYDDTVPIGWAVQCLVCESDFTISYEDVGELPPMYLPFKFEEEVSTALELPLVAVVEDAGTPDLSGFCPHCGGREWASFDGFKAHCFACSNDFIIAKLSPGDDDTFHIGGFK